MLTWWNNDNFYINARQYLHAWGHIEIYVNNRVFGFINKFNIKWLSDQMRNYILFMFWCFNQHVPNTNLKYTNFVPSTLLLKHILSESLNNICYCGARNCKCWSAHKVITL